MAGDHGRNSSFSSAETRSSQGQMQFGQRNPPRRRFTQSLHNSMIKPTGTANGQFSLLLNDNFIESKTLLNNKQVPKEGEMMRLHSKIITKGQGYSNNNNNQGYEKMKGIYGVLRPETANNMRESSFLQEIQNNSNSSPNNRIPEHLPSWILHEGNLTAITRKSFSLLDKRPSSVATVIRRRMASPETKEFSLEDSLNQCMVGKETKKGEKKIIVFSKRRQFPLKQVFKLKQMQQQQQQQRQDIASQEQQQMNFNIQGSIMEEQGSTLIPQEKKLTQKQQDYQQEVKSEGNQVNQCRIVSHSSRFQEEYLAKFEPKEHLQNEQDKGRILNDNCKQKHNSQEEGEKRENWKRQLSNDIHLKFELVHFNSIKLNEAPFPLFSKSSTPHLHLQTLFYNFHKANQNKINNQVY